MRVFSLCVSILSRALSVSLSILSLLYSLSSLCLSVSLSLCLSVSLSLSPPLPLSSSFSTLALSLSLFFPPQVDLCVEVERELGVPDWLMARVHKRRFWYLHPSAIYPSLEAYIDATHAALVADVRVYQAEVATAEAAHRKRRREALKAERAAAPPRLRAPSRRARSQASLSEWNRASDSEY
jgi:hypothetical protein